MTVPLLLRLVFLPRQRALASQVFRFKHPINLLCVLAICAAAANGVDLHERGGPSPHVHSLLGVVGNLGHRGLLALFLSFLTRHIACLLPLVGQRQSAVILTEVLLMSCVGARVTTG